MASGIFTLTGAAALRSGPAMPLAYLLSGAGALCAASVMAEFARELPVAGAGFTYTMLTLGVCSRQPCLPACLPAFNSACSLLPGMLHRLLAASPPRPSLLTQLVQASCPPFLCWATPCATKCWDHKLAGSSG